MSDQEMVSPVDAYVDTQAHRITARLWSPGTVFWTGLLLGWPGAVLLAALNWYRLGNPRKATWHLVIFFAGMLVFVWGALALPDGYGALPTLMISLSVLLGIKAELESDMPRGGYPRAGMFPAILICLGMLVVLFVVIFCFALVMSLFAGPSSSPPIFPLGGQGA